MSTLPVPDRILESEAAQLFKTTPEGAKFLHIKDDVTYGMSPGFHRVIYEALIIDDKYGTWGCYTPYAGSISYTVGEDVPQGFDPKAYIAELLGVPCLSGREFREKSEQATQAYSRRIAERLQEGYRQKFANIQGVELPADLSEAEKRKFLAAFSKVRGPRQKLADLFAAGSLFCAPSANKNRDVHFELEEDGLHCSVLGCAVLGITAGELPAHEDVEVMFWAVHAAARLISGSLRPVALIHHTAYGMQAGFSRATKYQHHYNGFWGPREIFETLMKSWSFAELADTLYKETSYIELVGVATREGQKTVFDRPFSYGSYAVHYVKGYSTYGF